MMDNNRHDFTFATFVPLYLCITTRCPNSLPGDVPYEVYTRKQAENALRVSRPVIILA